MDHAPLSAQPWTCLVPAYNEAPRLGTVLGVLADCPWLTQIIVVDDGSADETSEVAQACAATDGPVPPLLEVDPGATRDLPVDSPSRWLLLRHTRNAGKATALVTGFAHATTDHWLMVDADLLGCQPEHLVALALPIARGEAQMTTGIFRGGRLNTDAAHLVAPGLSGQRALTRGVWEQFRQRFPDPGTLGYGVEEALEDLVKHHGVTRELVEWRGVSHVTKEEKVGLLKGWEWRLQMFREVLKTRLGADWRARRGSGDDGMV